MAHHAGLDLAEAHRAQSRQRNSEVRQVALHSVGAALAESEIVLFAAAIVVDKVKNAKGNQGFNAQTEEYEDLMKAGVIDPTKVVRTALQNAASVAGLLLLTEALIAEKPEKKKGGGMPDMSGMGGMDDMM